MSKAKTKPSAAIAALQAINPFAAVAPIARRATVRKPAKKAKRSTRK